MIVQELRQIQERCGYLSDEEMRALSKRTGTPLHRIHEVASYYPLYRLSPPPAGEGKVSRDMACHLRGAPHLQQRLEAYGRELGEVEVCGVSCLGQCDRPVAVSINDHAIYRALDEKTLREIIRKAVNHDALPRQRPGSVPLAWKIDPYAGKPRYEALKKFVESRDAAA